MGQYALTCLVCGKPFVISKRAAKAFYCSDACNHKAWRARRKQRLAAEANQIDLASWEIYQFLLARRPDLDQALAGFFVAHKKQAFCEMLGLMAELVGYTVVNADPADQEA